MISIIELRESFLLRKLLSTDIPALRPIEFALDKVGGPWLPKTFNPSFLEIQPHFAWVFLLAHTYSSRPVTSSQPHRDGNIVCAKIPSPSLSGLALSAKVSSISFLSLGL